MLSERECRLHCRGCQTPGTLSGTSEAREEGRRAPGSWGLDTGQQGALGIGIGNNWDGAYLDLGDVWI